MGEIAGIFLTPGVVGKGIGKEVFSMAMDGIFKNVWTVKNSPCRDENGKGFLRKNGL